MRPARVWTLSCPGRSAGASSWMERVVLDIVYLLGVVVLALVVGLTGRGVEKL
ncbi:hypothetical protein LLS1_18090 [Leifsonia sp. LS1]|nr:hypothetical protein LLS1_18090 [Leifsonia sp. LS1]